MVYEKIPKVESSRLNNNVQYKYGDYIYLSTTKKWYEVLTKQKFFIGQHLRGFELEVKNPDGITVSVSLKNIVDHKFRSRNEETKSKETKMEKTLYEVDGKYATHLATNSAGDWVMEEKGTGSIFTAKEKDCEEVIPHTIDIKFLTSSDGTCYSYLAPKGKYKQGEVYLFDSARKNHSLVMVTRTDTKQKAATKEFKPSIKIVTEKVECPS